MRTKRAADCILAVFFTVMLVFTLFGEDLYRMTFPKVATETSVRRIFSEMIKQPDGSIRDSSRAAIMVPRDALSGNTVLVASETEHGVILSERVVETGEWKDGWVEVTDGLSGKAKVVIGSDRRVADGMRVIESAWNEQIAFHTAERDTIEWQEASSYMKRGLRKDLLCVAGLLAVTAGLVLACNRLLQKRLQVLKAPVLVLWCVLACLILKKTIVLPGEWIPEKLVDVQGWSERIKAFLVICFR